MLKGSSIIAGVGVIVLFHAGYSCAHYRRLFLIAPEVEELKGGEGPPFDVLLEVLVGFAICATGIIASAGTILPVKRQAKDRKAIASCEARPDFSTYNHRGVSFHKRAKARRHAT
jgi:hypothetical protein